MSIVVIPLQSGSKGNSFYIESADAKILIDAGISFRQAMLRLQFHNRDIGDVTDLLLTHDHSDHSRYVGDYCRRLNIPLRTTKPTLKVLERKSITTPKQRSICFDANGSFRIGDLQVHSISTPHDAVDGVVFVLDDGHHRIGLLTDLGHVFSGLKSVLKSLDAVIIESNYDEQLLDASRYPEFLKQRIRGGGGHLSNLEAARLLHQHASAKLQWACLCHLSDENNCPETALRTHQNWLGDDFPLYVADRHRVSDPLAIKANQSI